jgi:quercetin dioxygenase-like cupin family protein
MNSQELRVSLDPADPDTFVGPAFIRLLAAAEEQVQVKLYFVRFEPGGRTNWHSHAGTQILVVSKGRCRFQREHEAVRELAPGESVRIEPGVRHWHGASPDEATEHFAVNLEIRETSWDEAVSEEEYARPPSP